jgi:hypothetical protein
MKIFYRISDNSYAKTKIPGATKHNCLRNFINCFTGSEKYVIADNVTAETLSMINDIFDGQVFVTKSSNAKSFIWSIKKAIELFSDDEEIYFCEDDYFHRLTSEIVLQEGLKISNYVTLYDHPDKYNKFGVSESSVVYRTKSCHWRKCVSTCMTFGTHVKDLKEDFEILNRWTTGSHPHDHQMFHELTTQKGKSLISAIPGLACHLDLTFPLQNDNMNLIEDWAYNIAEKFLIKNKSMPEELKDIPNLQKLILLEEYLK